MIRFCGGMTVGVVEPIVDVGKLTFDVRGPTVNVEEPTVDVGGLLFDVVEPTINGGLTVS